MRSCKPPTNFTKKGGIRNLQLSLVGNLIIFSANFLNVIIDKTIKMVLLIIVMKVKTVMMVILMIVIMIWTVNIVMLIIVIII